MSKNVLVIAAHPDDEVLSCGGTIARHADRGDKVGVLFIADGVGARLDNFENSLMERKQSALKALKILGANCLGFLDLPDNSLDTVPLLSIVQKIEGFIKEFSPSVIYTHHGGDLNIDHSLVYKATLTACRPVPGSIVKEIYSYEVLSSTEWATYPTYFVPNYFVDISNTFNKKMLAIDCYKNEMRDYPHTRSLEALKALAIHRGTSVGLELAESFMMIRCIND